MTNTLPDRISNNFCLAEVTHSEAAARYGIVNELPPELLEAVVNTAVGMEKVRAGLGFRPITVSSWYRCPELNASLGSNSTSQHIKGEAVDFICPAYGSPEQICKLLVTLAFSINYDQLIFEHTWVHISWNSNPGAVQRNQVLSLLNTRKYSSGITNQFGEPI